MTFIESWGRRCARRNADRISVAKSAKSGLLEVRYGDKLVEVLDSTPDREKTLREVRVAIDRLMAWEPGK